MLTFVWIFSLFTALYHIIVTTLWYGLLDWQYPQIWAMIRDGTWLLFVLIIFLANYKSWKSYLKKRKNVWISMIVLIAFSVLVSLLNGKELFNMIVGIKYDFYYLIILLSSTILWFMGLKKLNKNRLKKILHYAQYILIWIVVVGFLWQIKKFFNIDWFEKIGYGPIGDFVFWANPPVYYRTWPWGISRWQGLFSWPNNYGYFLVALFPVALLWRKPTIKKLKDVIKLNIHEILNIWILLAWVAAIVLTLSRTALIWWVIALLFVNKKWIIKNKKTSAIIGIILLWWLVALSILKWWSTLEHLASKIEWIQFAMNNSLWYGLGTAGPAIHHGGTILPENYFLQLMIDIGTVGFILWIITLFQILSINKKIQNFFANNKTEWYNQTLYLHLNRILIGRSCLLIMWFLLHVFEDSMVNYLFFIPYGILIWYLSKLYTEKKNNFWGFIKHLKRR